jgi:hypothetical protein
VAAKVKGQIFAGLFARGARAKFSGSDLSCSTYLSLLCFER